MRRASDVILSCTEGGADDWDDWETVVYDKKTGKTKPAKKNTKPKKKKTSFVITDPLGEGGLF
tara:strand:+ start:463 stop:651 length:189 start_codon:yes stop_codon:yes gene_type:complete